MFCCHGGNHSSFALNIFCDLVGLVLFFVDTALLANLGILESSFHHCREKKNIAPMVFAGCMEVVSMQMDSKT
jgi:hypothetical protein